MKTSLIRLGWVLVVAVSAGCGAGASSLSSDVGDASAVQTPPVETKSCPIPSAGACACGICQSCSCNGSVWRCVNATSATCCLSDADCSGGFACDTATHVCLTSCTAISGCGAGYTCSGGACLGGLGVKCSSDAGCVSGHCADSVCCNTACRGSCEACATWTKGTLTTSFASAPPGGGSVGTCATNPAGTQPLTGIYQAARAACSAPIASSSTPCGNACNGVDASACHAALATTPCSAKSCGGTAAAPTETQLFCNGAGACGTTPVATSCGSYECASGACKTSCVAAATDCLPGDSCDSFGRCEAPGGAGQQCSTDVECTSGHCADGYCCDTACAGQCEACDVAGSVGTCSNVSGRPHGARTPCPGAASCVNATLTSASVCNGAGSCVAGATSSCSPYGCNAAGSACRASCATTTDCAGGFVCESGGCAPAPSATCSADGTSSNLADGGAQSCAPYLCLPNGTCGTSCALTSDCGMGYTCDVVSKSCVQEPASQTSSGGCAVLGASSAGPGTAAPWIALGLVVWRRRRRR